jgi:serine/threonine protein kinase/tetratricopeptide (TPR) repeat protein
MPPDPFSDDDLTRDATGGGSQSSHPHFRAAELVGGRFRIVRLIGQGGMGAVYEAEDLELGGRVALKRVRPETAADSRAIERFKQEIYLARKVTHPNVCRIFDLFHHHDPASDDSVVFVTMELLCGETLAERLRRSGRMNAAELVPLVTQMAEGLDAAHQAGIIHRDFKPSNVVLVPLKDGSQIVRAVVTDFGLALTHASDGRRALTLTGTRDLVGTPAYIAPELLDNRPATPATDIYALGVVMYEMVTGRLPFPGDTPLSVVFDRLRRPAESPRVLVPELEPRFEAIILRCLERDPADRFASISDVVRALHGDKPAPIPSRQRRRTRRVVLTASAIAVLTPAIAGLAMWATRERAASTAETRASTPPMVRRSVAVLGFKNLSQRPEAAWLSPAFSDMLSTELAAGEKLRMVPGEQVVRMKLDLRLADADSFASDTLARIRANLGTDLVLLGSYMALGEKGNERIRIDLRVQDAVAGETIASVTETGTQAELLNLVSRAGTVLRDRLGAGELSSGEAARMRASLPRNPEVVRLYTEGLGKLRSSENLAARDLFAQVVAAEPEFPLAHSALAATWLALGYEAKAAEAAKRAFELAGDLPRQERLSIEGRYRETTRERQKATEIYRTLFDFFPDNIDYGLRLAAAQTSAGTAKDALQTLDTLRRLPAVLQDDPRIDLAEARAAGALSDFNRQLAAADRAAQRALARGAPVLLAQARLAQAEAFAGLGQLDKRIGPLDEARRIYAAAGDRAGVADTLTRMAVVRRLQGEQTEPFKLYEQALEMFREMGNEAGMATVKSNIANMQMRLGRLAEAQKLFEETLVSFRQVGRKDAMAIVLNNLAIIQRQQGDFDDAMAYYEQSLAISREIGSKAQMANTTGNMANLLSPRGDLARARTLYEEALAISREIGDKTTSARTLGNLSLVLVKQGEIPAAINACEQAVLLSREVGERREVAYALKHFGNALHHQGELTRAAAQYDEALTIARALDEKSLMAEAASGFGHVLFAQGRVAEAKSRYQEALAIRQAVVKNAVADTRLDLASVAMEEGRFTEAEGLARQTIAAYRDLKEPDSIAAASAVLARALLAQGKVAAARTAVESAVTSARGTQNQFVRVAVATTGARVHAASRDTARIATAAASLAQIVDDTSKTGSIESQLEARLALGQLEIARGNRSTGLAQIVTVQGDASAKGLGLIAKRALAAPQTSDLRLPTK